ncbi:MAG TPA: hypothetical protein VEP90_03920 [Methylomirabilota bacterium]|nr:hypothetical protein [Methylomirabilota bacterium]
MIPASKFQTQLLIASAFIAGDELKLTNAFIQALQEWSTIYDGDPMSLPLSQAVPPDFPTAILQSRDQSLGIELARAKINLYWKRLELNKDASIDISNIYSQFAERIATIAEKNKVVIGRLAALRMSMGDEPTPGRVLSKQFCREEILSGPLRGVEGFELHAHKVFELYQAQNVNSWVRIKTSGSPGPDYEHIFVEQDINTLAEEINIRNFDRANIMRFFREASEQLDSILIEYFPGKTEELGHD